MTDLFQKIAIKKPHGRLSIGSGARSAMKRAVMTLALLMLTTTTASSWEINSYCYHCGYESPCRVISVNSPTCYQEGHYYVECEICGLFFIVDIPALGHDWGAWSGTYREPTCYDAGGYVHTCNRCGATETDGSAPALGHDLTEETYIAPTCTEIGGLRQECRRAGCHFSITWSPVPALGHAWDEYDICTRCNKPNGDIALADDDDNRGKISRLATLGSIAVTLQGRTLYKDGYWNTLCLPFTLADLSGTPLVGAEVKEIDTETTYNGHKTGLEDQTLYLNFKDVSGIEAGKPYIIRWNSGEDITNPVFSGVTIDDVVPTAVTSTDNKVTFTGTYAPFAIDLSNIDKVIYLGSGNTIGYASAAKTLRPFRAHFDVLSGGTNHAVIRQVLFNDGTTTEVIPIVDVNDNRADDAWYTIYGIRINGMPTEKGLYIHNGNKHLIK